ncbi:hypothetical protein SHT67_14345 (plasmid) [Enterococcus faecalis]|uniref:hypothetical protein n=1 Tax=Enterococcus faecalis TaxID=1351 RepID=UPI0029C66CD5|nr:hypothetical protein [Enterococcus faecalis]WPH48355.1 hypothetical protein SHT67_14345 [Enterococcus faecalis]
MSEKKWYQVRKNQIIGVSVVAALAIGGGSVYAVNTQKKAQAEKIELAQKQEKEAYKKLTDQVNDSIQKAYDTRDTKDIESAETLIKQLKEPDQKTPKEKMTKLHSFLDLIKKTDQLLVTAEKTKKDSDIQAAQNSINNEKDDYLKKDKTAHQQRLDKLKKSIADEKAKADAKKKAEQEKAQAEAEAKKQEAAAAAQAQANTQTAEATQQVPDQQAQAPETAQGNVATYEAPQAPAAEVPQYQAPAPQQPVEQVPAQPQPQQPAPAPQPQQPSTGGGRGVMTQEELNQAAEEASQMDPTKDPNSPWYKH